MYFRDSQRIYGAKFTESAADDIVRCCLSLYFGLVILVEPTEVRTWYLLFSEVRRLPPGDPNTVIGEQPEHRYAG